MVIEDKIYEVESFSIDDAVISYFSSALSISKLRWDLSKGHSLKDISYVNLAKNFKNNYRQNGRNIETDDFVEELITKSFGIVDLNYSKFMMAKKFRDTSLIFSLSGVAFFTSFLYDQKPILFFSGIVSSCISYYFNDRFYKYFPVFYIPSYNKFSKLKPDIMGNIKDVKEVFYEKFYDVSNFISKV